MNSFCVSDRMSWIVGYESLMPSDDHAPATRVPSRRIVRSGDERRDWPRVRVRSRRGARPGLRTGRAGLARARNRGRMLDSRRTPIAITEVAPERGEFELEI